MSVAVGTAVSVAVGTAVSVAVGTAVLVAVAVAVAVGMGLVRIRTMTGRDAVRLPTTSVTMA